jgi:hypothetical protein
VRRLLPLFALFVPVAAFAASGGTYAIEQPGVVRFPTPTPEAAAVTPAATPAQAEPKLLDVIIRDGDEVRVSRAATWAQSFQVEGWDDVRHTWVAIQVPWPPRALQVQDALTTMTFDPVAPDTDQTVVKLWWARYEMPVRMQDAEECGGLAGASVTVIPAMQSFDCAGPEGADCEAAYRTEFEPCPKLFPRFYPIVPGRSDADAGSLARFVGRRAHWSDPAQTAQLCQAGQASACWGALSQLAPRPSAARGACLVEDLAIMPGLTQDACIIAAHAVAAEVGGLPGRLLWDPTGERFRAVERGDDVAGWEPVPPVPESGAR